MCFTLADENLFIKFVFRNDMTVILTDGHCNTCQWQLLARGKEKIDAKHTKNSKERERKIFAKKNRNMETRKKKEDVECHRQYNWERKKERNNEKRKQREVEEKRKKSK